MCGIGAELNLYGTLVVLVSTLSVGAFAVLKSDLLIEGKPLISAFKKEKKIVI